MKHLFLILFSLLVYGCDKEGSEEVYIPDAKFKEQLLFNKDINEYNNLKNWDGKIKNHVSDIEGYSGWKNFLHFFNFINHATLRPKRWF